MPTSHSGERVTVFDRDELPIEIARQIDRLCLEFEQEWQQRRHPRLEDYLQRWSGSDQYRSAFLQELLCIELDALRRQGKVPKEDYYDGRFPRETASIQRAFDGDSQRSAAYALTVDAAAVDDAAGGLPPQFIGRYEVQQVIGRGAFGVVYQAYDPRLDCQVAIKRLQSEQFADAPGCQRIDFPSLAAELLSEAQLAAQVRQYEGIVTVLDVIIPSELETAREMYFVQEYVEGKTLKELIQTGPVAPVDAARLLVRVAQAMDRVHARGIYHRDLKPGNIILDAHGNPNIVDFGLAVNAQRQQGLRGEVSGTLPYMAPEQVRGEAHLLDGRADIWALGVILYEMLTGQRPFRGNTRMELFDAICRREPAPLRTVNPQLPVELERICQKCLSKRMTDRYATAGELSEDLRQWQGEYEAGWQPPAVADPATVVPKGLRSFDEEDASFFLDLLPGPRHRDGLPESLRFWKRRIEQSDPTQSFRVGLLYGPSGCGKTSIIRAGLLPRLRKIIPAYVEATAADTEARILGQLRRAIPQLTQDLSLPESIVALRGNPDWSGFKKIVLVIDQFEQWLQTRTSHGREQLIEALRQCDGMRVQTIILVRDDFWMAVTRFFRDLEIDLVPAANVMAVDLFPPEHARGVLEQMGRAYGTINAAGPPTDLEQQFLSRVVEGLTEEGTVVCVRLAVFADMVKTKPWVPSTIDEVGGTDGVGERFLDEAFTAQAANPRHRAHEQAARKVLRALLPQLGTNIKGHMQSYSQLHSVSGYEDRPQEFDELLQILDGELRLITPTDPSGLDVADAAELRQRHYQLTHDYLVPALRRWLNRRLRSTRQGRAQLLATELADSWHLKPDPRRLPGLLEWLQVVWWIPRSERSLRQRTMIQAATRRLGRSALIWMVALLLVGWLGYETYGRFQARAIVDQVVSAQTRELPLIVPTLRDFQRWTQPSIQQQLAAGEAVAEQELTDRDVRRRRHLQLALAALDPAQTDVVIAQLNEMAAEEMPVVSELLQPHAAVLSESLWRKLVSLHDRREPVLNVAAVLAGFSPEDQRWAQYQNVIARQLLDARARDVSRLQPLLKPVGPLMATALLARARAQPELSDAQRVNWLGLISDFSADSPDLLTAALELSHPHELPELLSQLEPHGQSALPSLRSQLARIDAGQNVPQATPALDDEVRQLVEDAEGAADTEVYVQRLRREDFAALHAQLQQAGRGISSLRPYRDAGGLFVAAVWRPGAEQNEVQWDLPYEQLASLGQRMENEGLVPVDIARYDDGAGTGRWVMVWSRDRESLPNVRFSPAATTLEFLKQYDSLPGDNFGVTRFDVWMAPDGVPRCSLLWWKGDEWNIETLAKWRYERTYGDLAPGLLQMDLRCEEIPPGTRDRIGIYEGLSRYQYEASILSGNDRASRMLWMVRDYSSMGEADLAQDLVDELSPRWSGKSRLFHEIGALQAARAGDRAALDEHIKTYAKWTEGSTPVDAYLQFRRAVLAEDTDQCTQAVNVLESLPADDPDRSELLARAYALQASMEDDPEARAELADRSCTLLAERLSDRNLRNPGALVFDVDFDALRDTNAFQNVVSQAGLRRIYATSYAHSPDHESRQVLGLDPQAHRERARQLMDEGFHPHVLNVRQTIGGQASCCSVWHRPVSDPEDLRQLAHRRANLLLAAARMGDFAPLQSEVRGHDPNARSYLVLHAASVLPAWVLQELLDEATIPTETSAVALMLGAIPADELEPSRRKELLGVLHDLCNEDNPGVHSAALWCLRQWNIEEPPRIGKRNREFRNSVGQRMLVIDPPERNLMGTSTRHFTRGEQERRHWVSIPRIYALADTETTVAQFHRFLADERVRRYYGGSVEKFSELRGGRPEQDQRPIVGVTWRDAALFCQWLSEQDPELAAEDYCYPEAIWDVDADQFKMEEGYPQRRGYRLPTESEWEWAARGGAIEALRHCGSDEDVLFGFAWFGRNADRQRHPVGHLRPNDYGFFDLLGNVREWCDDRHHPYVFPAAGAVRIDTGPTSSEDLSIHPTSQCAIRGGDFLRADDGVRSGDRMWSDSNDYFSTVGFRVARTVSPRPIP